MSVPTVTSTTSTASVTPVTAEPTAATTPTGIASTPSTLAPSEQNSNRFTAWVSRVCDSILSCLKWFNNWLIRLPYIGTFFRTTAEDNAIADEQLVEQIRAALAVTNDVGHALELFGQLRTPRAKAEVFFSVLCGVNSTDDIARQFYANLPVYMQNEFKRQIWVENNQQDNGHGIGYGDYVVAHEIRGEIAVAAAGILEAGLFCNIDFTTYFASEQLRQQTN